MPTGADPQTQYHTTKRRGSGPYGSFSWRWDRTEAIYIYIYEYMHKHLDKTLKYVCICKSLNVNMHILLVFSVVALKRHMSRCESGTIQGVSLE